MSRRAPRTANAVSLFPFLAVLICAMGALILLLLVTTRRIRHQQTQSSAVVAPQPDNEVHTPQPVPEPPAQNAPARFPEYLAAPLEPLFALEPVPAAPDPNAPWRARLQSLEAMRKTLADIIDSQTAAIDRCRHSAQTAAAEIDHLTRQTADIEKQKQELEHAFTRLQQDEIDADERARFLRRKIDESREQLAHADSRYSIIPFDGRLGTTRRPIILECTEDSITFVSERVSLNARDLDGFTSRYNPVLMASHALSSYWARKDRLDGAETEGAPYVLLVVRPKGTIAYYVARKLLGNHFDNFGYELVREDQEFVWPDSDPVATRLCREIVDRMMAERNALLATMPESARQSTREYSNGGGSFRLEEVDRIRNPGRGVFINGQRIDRDSRTASSAGSPEHWDSRNPQRMDFAPGGSEPRRLFTSESEDSFEPTGTKRAPGGSHQDLTAFRPAESEHPLRNPFQDIGRSPGAEATKPLQIGQSANALHAGEGGPTAGGTASLANQGDLQAKEQGGGGTAPREQEEKRRSTNDGALDLVPLSQKHAPQGADGHNPQWGIHRPGGLIGFEREILVRVTTSQVTIADETAFAIAPGISADDLRRLFAAHLNHQVRSWGEPPRSFYWLPTVNFMVSPGGIQFYERLRATTTDHWKLRSTVKHVLE